LPRVFRIPVPGPFSDGPLRKCLVARRATRYTFSPMKFFSKTFRLLLVGAIAVAVSGSGLQAVAGSCIVHHSILVQAVEPESCCDGLQGHGSVYPGAAELEHGHADNGCACSVDPISEDRIEELRGVSRAPRITRALLTLCSTSRFSPVPLNSVGTQPVQATRTAGHLPSLRTVVLRV
jgi:hypothetical protein